MSGAVPEPVGTPALAVRELGVQISGRPILAEIDLTVDRGEVVAVLGENGSGKSTLVRAALGLQHSSRGEVRLFGTPLGDFRDWARVGYVPQHSPAVGGVPASVAEVVASGRLSRRRLLAPLRRADRDAIAAALETVGLSDRANEAIGTLSGGQQQRALIARALAGEPELLVLDEPNAGVDAGSQAAIAETLARLVDRGATLVVVLHELGPLEPLIGRTVVLGEGRVSYDGPPRAGLGAAAHHHDVRPSARGPVHAPFDGRDLDDSHGARLDGRKG